MMKLLLASKSPRRQELIKMLEIPYSVVSLGDVDEVYPPDKCPDEVAAYLSKLKASAYKNILNEDEILVTADTIVMIDKEILGKPRDLEDAKRILMKLSGKVHRVITGVTLTSKEKSVTFSTITDVYFAHLSKEHIDFYVEKFKPLDKAGAYGIQEWIGAVGINRIDGSFYNVMGLPVHQLYKELQKF